MSQHDENRRRFVRDGSLLVGAALSGALQASRAWSQPLSGSDPHPARDRLLTRIAFGSCARQDKEQPIWDSVLATRPDLFVFLGDNIYGDTRDMSELRRKYAQLAAKPGFRKLRASTPVLAIWDDHDYGENDAGADYPMKEQSRQIFLDFWEEPADSPRRSRNGIYASYVFGPEDRRVQVILPDLRYNRTPIARQDLGGMSYEEWEAAMRKAGGEVPGPYARSPEHAATMLGERQWAWLEEQFEVPAQLRIFASSLQVFADFPGWEAWANYARDQQRLIDLIRRKRAGGVIFISGDTHYAELTRLDVNVPYPFWELTSSGLTEVWPVNVPNANRLGPQLREANFGLIEIDWRASPVRVTLKACDIGGIPRIEQRVSLADLQYHS